MRRVRLAGLAVFAVLGLMLLPVAGQAALLDFNITASTEGTISYAGGSSPLIGAGIVVNDVTGLGTPQNDGLVIDFSDEGLTGILDFQTGQSTGTWTWGANPESFITLGLYDANSNLIANLISGEFGSATVTYSGNSFYVSIASFYDTKWETLLDVYGLPYGDYVGNFNISFNAPYSGAGTAFESTYVLSGDVVNQPVPEPGTMMLLGSGLVGLAGWGRRMFRK